jgi:amino acid adenylation domain-containing protein
MTSDRSGGGNGLSAGRQALLKQRLSGSSTLAVNEIPRRDPGTPIPLTPVQMQMWAIAENFPDSHAYNMHRAMRMRGHLDIDKLKLATSRLLLRHEALRTVFKVDNRAIVQSYDANIEVDLEVHRTADAEAQARSAFMQPFNLRTEPPVRFMLFEESTDSFLFLMVVHHIVADEWSLGICMRDLHAAYSEIELDEGEPLQFGDYLSQENPGGSRSNSQHSSWWQEALRDHCEDVQLPTDSGRLPRRSLDGDFFRVPLDSDLAATVSAESTRQGVTPFIFYFTAFKVLLARLSGETAFAVGVPAANRSSGRAETSVGLYVSSLPLPSDIDFDRSFSGCLQASNQRFLDALMRQDIAIDELVTALDYERKPGVNPLFQTMFVMETESAERLEWPELECEAVEFNCPSAKFDLTLFVRPDGRFPAISIEYNNHMFSNDTANRVVECYLQVLRQALDMPDAPVVQLEIVPTGMRDRLLTQIGNGGTLPPAEMRSSSLPARILRAAERAPENIAISFERQSIRYTDLASRAKQIAVGLRASGVQPGDLVGVHVGRSVEQITAVIGVLFSAAAYVPMDPEYPQDRLDTIRDDIANTNSSGRVFIVSTSSLLERANPSDTVMNLDDLLPANGVSGFVPPEIDDASLAYVIYTSGSSGRPKGVRVSHGNLAASNAAREQFYDPPQKFLLASSFAFDSSVAGLFWTLANGGTITIPASRESNDPVALARLISEHQITHTLLLPSLWRWIIFSHDPGGLDSLQSVIVAGEVCSRELLDIHFAVVPNASLYNEYGPTEATVWSSVHECRMAAKNDTSVPIGRPIPGGQLYVLDQSQRLVPIGVAGELYVGGHGVAQGYLRRRAETEQLFLADPFFSGGMMYRTGDRVRWKSDGTLEFIGRVDQQMKIRGYRIEPTEIEAHLNALDGIDSAAVALVKNDPNETSIDDDISRWIARLPAKLVEQMLDRIENNEERM